MTADRYISTTSQRLLQLIEVLAGHEIDGIRPAELARALDVSASIITRDLANLEHRGWAQKVEDTGGWRLTPKVGRISTTIHSNLARHRARLDEVEQRFSRAL